MADWAIHVMQLPAECSGRAWIESVHYHRHRIPIHLISIQWFDFHQTHWPPWWMVRAAAVRQAARLAIYRPDWECMQRRRPQVWLPVSRHTFYRHICSEPVGCCIRHFNQAIIHIIIHRQRRVCLRWAIIQWSLHFNMPIMLHCR